MVIEKNMNKKEIIQRIKSYDEHVDLYVKSSSSRRNIIVSGYMFLKSSQARKTTTSKLFRKVKKREKNSNMLIN